MRRPEPFSRPMIVVDLALLVLEHRLAGRRSSVRFARSAASMPERLPKISVSSSELAPSRLPPWTETQATSPAA